MTTPVDAPIGFATGAGITGGASLQAVVAPVPHHSLLADTIAPYTPSRVRLIHDEGGRGIIGYLGINLTRDAIANAFALNMGVLPVNPSRGEGWIPTAELGASDAASSIAKMVALAIPVGGLYDWCDIEGCGASPTAYCQAWCDTLTHDGAGRVSGEYVGAGALLSGHQHYLLPFKGYWHSCSAAIPEPDSGFMMFQGYPPNQQLPDGEPVDWNFVVRDFRNRAPTWLVAARP